MKQARSESQLSAATNRAQAVCWDMGGVLLRTIDWKNRRSWELRLGLRPGALEQRVFEGEVGRLAMLGRATAEDVWADLARAYGLTDEEHRNLRSDFFAGDRMDDVLLGYIASLRPITRTALISNAWLGIRGVLGNAAGPAVFDELIVSSEVGVVKPDPLIFQIALDRLRLPPAAAVFVDDMPRNLEAARAVGMRPVMFNGTQRTIEAVERLFDRS